MKDFICSRNYAEDTSNWNIGRLTVNSAIVFPMYFKVIKFIKLRFSQNDNRFHAIERM